MKRIFVFLVLIVIGLVGFGFYHGWFQVSSNSSGGKTHIGITVDKNKIEEDEKKALEKVKEVGSEVKDKAVDIIDKSKK